MKIKFMPADPVRDAVELSELEKDIDPVDAWEVEDWEPYYKVFRVFVNSKRIGHIALSPNQSFHRSSSDKLWAKPGSLYLANTGILPKYRTYAISNAVRRWQIQWAKDRGWDVLSTNCRKSDKWYLSLCERFNFDMVGDVPYFIEPTENTIVLQLNLDKPKNRQ